MALVTRNYVVSGLVLARFKGTWGAVKLSASRIGLVPLWALDAFNITVTGSSLTHHRMRLMQRASFR